MATVTRRDRLVDLAALLLIVAGIALYGLGTYQLRRIARFSYQHPGPPGTKQLKMADRARYAANTGIAVVVLGAAMGVASAVRVARRRTP